MEKLTLEEKHGIILEIMSDIDKFCRDNNIRYTISAGTLLGAVRHGGFIPWDDDADLFMLREDFDRFVKIYKSDKYHLLFNTCSKEEFLCTGFAKVIDPNTYVVGSATQAKYGVYVDIFPLDSVPEEPKARHKYMHKVMRLHNRLYHRQQNDLLSFIKSYYHSLDWWRRKCEEIVHSGLYDNSGLVAQMIGTNNYRTVVPKNWFDNLEEFEFEGRRFFGFKDTHAYLSMLYGADYMTPKKWNHDEAIYRR